MFSIADLPHRPGVVYYHLLLRRETRIPGVAPFSFRIGIWDLFVHRGQKSCLTWTSIMQVGSSYLNVEVFFVFFFLFPTS